MHTVCWFVFLILFGFAVDDVLGFFCFVFALLLFRLFFPWGVQEMCVSLCKEEERSVGPGWFSIYTTPCLYRLLHGTATTSNYMHI